jgi:hypothetical protein
MYKEYRAFCGFVKVTLMLDTIVLILGCSFWILHFLEWNEKNCLTCIAEFVISFGVFVMCFVSYYLSLKGVSPIFSLFPNDFTSSTTSPVQNQLREQRKWMLTVSQIMSFLICGYQGFRMVQFHLRDSLATQMPPALYYVIGISFLLCFVFCFCFFCFKFLN